MPMGAIVMSLACWPGAQGPAIDVSRLSFGPPMAVAEVDTSRLKGDLKRLAWEPDGAALYLQTVEGKSPDEKVRHYTIDITGGHPVPVDREPDWAAQYWAVKQDRVAPGLPSLVIDVQQGVETLKAGVGTSGVLDRQSSPDAVAGGSPSASNLADGTPGNQYATVTRLKLAGEDIAVWINERPFPGAKFSWDPSGSGALVYTGERGELVFFDRKKHRKTVPDVKDASLPAWSSDGPDWRSSRRRAASEWRFRGSRS